MCNGDGTEKNIETPAPRNTEKPSKCQATRKSCPTELLAARAMTTAALIPKIKSGSAPKIRKWRGSSPCRYLMTAPIATNLRMWIEIS